VTLRILVVDDEPVALQRVELALKGLPEVELVGLTDDGRSAIELIRAQRPDIVLLDVQMPAMNGFDVAEALRQRPEKPEIVFLTAHDEHAVRAFEVQAADYLLKPVSFARLKEAIRKAGERVLARRADVRLAEMQALLELENPARGQAGHDDQLWIRDGLGLTRIEVGSVDLFRAEGDYVAARCGATEHLLREPISSLAERLNPSKFIRVHRSAIVNLAQIRKVNRRSRRSLVLVLKTGEQVAVGPSYTDAVLQALGVGRWR
jgi:DNA-binding LytR/AlgR family response regulator